jgi:hypothetical protein
MRYPYSPDDPAVVEKIQGILQSSPSYQNLDRRTRNDVAEAMSKIATYLASGNGETPLASQMAPDLSQLRVQNNPPPQQGSNPGFQSSPAPQPGTTTPSPAPSGGSSGTTGRVGEVARATLNAIDFPAFVAGLIQGTFQAIVDASIKQMEAYAELLKNVAGTVDRFMTDNVTDGSARDYLADQYSSLLSRDTSGGQPRLRVQQNQPNDELPSFFKDLGFNSPSDIDDRAVEEVVVPAARRQMAESRQKTLATMVLMGINRVVVDDGEITAKLQFHIDASEATNIRFDQTKTTAGNMSGYAGRSPFGAQSVMVNTASMNAQSDINVRADLTGQVKVKFRSETFPLERFADSAAIQLISSNAKVPQAAPAPAAAPVAAAPAATPAPAAAPPPRPAPPAAPPAVASQGLAAAYDPWAPEA